MRQDVVYSDRKAVESALTKLERLPPLVTPLEICKLKKQLHDVALGKAFLLQGGDCAELFDYCEPDNVDAKIKLLLQMSLVLIAAINKPVVRIARMAGQYAKPRSKPVETTADGREVPAFRGDILNGFDVELRDLDPSRLVSAYFHSAATLNHIRAQLSSGIADLHNPLDWNLGHVIDKELQSRYQKIVDEIVGSLRFLQTIGADTAGPLKTVDVYTSHESLLLEYEQCMTRNLAHPKQHMNYKTGTENRKGWYDTSAHFVWVGDRTRQLDGAHVEFLRGLENPIGIKVGPSMATDELIELLDTVDPDKEPGKVTLITRYGESKVDAMLGVHIDGVKRSGHIPVWQCDPMHGNTISLPDGTKTRRFSSILAEVASALRIHQEHHSFLGGIHLELTGDAVTECVGGSEGLDAEDLKQRYTTYCDPRLNEKQALELTFLVAGHYRKDSNKA